MLLNLIFIGLSFSSNFYNIETLLNNLEISSPAYRGKIQLFSYYSTQSCIYQNQDFILIEHYCYPKKNYPAIGYTIISHDYGMLDIYYEFRGIEKKSITLTTFKEDLKLNFPKNLNTLSLADINGALESNHYRYGRACWVLKQEPRQPNQELSCYKANEEDKRKWLEDAFSYVDSTHQWRSLIDRLFDFKSH